MLILTAYIQTSNNGTAKIALYQGKERVTMTPASWAQRANVVGATTAGKTMTLKGGATRHQTAYTGIIHAVHYLEPFMKSNKYKVVIAVNDALVVSQLKGETNTENEDLQNLKAVAYASMRAIKPVRKPQLMSIASERVAKAIA